MERFEELKSENSWAYEQLKDEKARPERPASDLSGAMSKDRQVEMTKPDQEPIDHENIQRLVRESLIQNGPPKN